MATIIYGISASFISTDVQWWWIGFQSVSKPDFTPAVYTSGSQTEHELQSPEGLFNCSLLGPTPRVSDIVGLEGDPGIYIFNKFPGNAYAASPEATLRDPCSIPFFASL